MPSLSTPIGELRSRYGVVVVGSGYGASVAAYRMARLAAKLGKRKRPTFSVCVLERGLEIATGDYPSSLYQVARQMQVDNSWGRIGASTALFDLRLNHDISALVGCGLGGGSLINAGVMLPPLPALFNDRSWPTGIRGKGLEKYFAAVRGELDVRAVPDRIELLKVTRLFKSAEASPHPKFGQRPDIAVSFRTEVNRHGVQRKECVLCGDCMTGCNHSAKNTLLANYLPAAANAGAAIFCRMDVRAIERREDGRWLVRVRVLDRAFRMFGSPELTLEADAVFLGAGTLGSVEILLRSRGLALSPRLGERFSGNGDVIAFAYNAPEPVNGVGYGSYVPQDAAVGPLIGGMIDERKPTHGSLLQEGTIPGALIPLLRFAAPVMARVSRRPIDLSGTLRFSHFRRELDSMIRGARHGALRRTQTFLGMGHDGSKGTMTLSGDRLRLRWPRRLDGTVIKHITERMGELTRGMKGRYLVNPFWSRVFGRRRVTVHPLGGACMADRAEDGVVNGNGQVFAGRSGDGVHRGLYVCDGAVMPTSLGANPALTIAAVAERIAKRSARTISAIATKAPTRRPGRVRTSVAGIHYGERLRGRIRLGVHESRFRLVLHISAENLRRLIEDDAHRARVVGVLTAPEMPPGLRRFTVSNGRFKVMVDDPTRVDSKLIKYAFTLTADNGSVFEWKGQKTINHDTAKKRGVWKVISSYDFVVRDAARRVTVGGGVARSSILDAIRLSLSIRITNERAWLDRQMYRRQYTRYFMRSLFNVLVRSLASTPGVNPFADETAVKLPESIKKYRTANDTKRHRRPRFKLTSYVSTTKEHDQGAVILAPGFGMSAYAFLLKNSLTEYLCDKGYEVWLLDYRGSDRLAASLEQFTLDDLAVGDETLSGDFPDAIKAVYEKNGNEPVQVIAHCVASLSMFMALLAGTLDRTHLRSVILSQSFACLNHPGINRFKAWIRLPQFLRYMGFMAVMTPDYHLRSGWKSKLLDRLLIFYPTNERCSSGVCRRLLLMYGEVIRHDQLTKETHDLLHHLFDRANMTTFVHLSKMVSRGRVVDKDGKNVYLTPANIGRLNVPITLVQGSGNRLFKPRGAVRTLRELIAHGGHGTDNKNWFRLKYVDGHGHLDTFIGKRAPEMVYPMLWNLLTEAPEIAAGQRDLAEAATSIGPSIKWGSNSASVGS